MAAVLLEGCPTAGRAVDLGCGTGLSAEPLTRRGWEVIGVDRSAAMLRRATARGRLTRSVLADAAATELPGGWADLVLMNNLLHLCPQPAAVLAEARRLLAPGGRIVCVWPAETANFAEARRADQLLGRLLPSLLLAATLRLVVGLAGFLTRARRWRSRHVTATVFDWAASHGWVCPRDGVVCGVEQYVVLNRPACRAAELIGSVPDGEFSPSTQ
ncbi:MAG: class I SAM-dependent methyltransferase [Propionibacteriaceae bacterium]|nr:class I SAM-dependent methyltransferase [Propionibacteriaceae bacterium]